MTEQFNNAHWNKLRFEKNGEMCGEIGGVMRYRIILATMVWITPQCALMYMVHVVATRRCTHQRGEYGVLLTSTCCQHVDKVNFLNLSFGPCKGPDLLL